MCGDAKAMAKDVHRTLVDLCMAATKCTAEQAEAELKKLGDQGRYLRDVW